MGGLTQDGSSNTRPEASGLLIAWCSDRAAISDASPGLNYRLRVPERAERRAAREAIAAYHEAELTALLSHVSLALESLGGGELDAFDVDQVVFQYSRAAKELWKFCNASDIESLAAFLAEAPEMGWWERGAFRKR